VPWTNGLWHAAGRQKILQTILFSDRSVNGILLDQLHDGTPEHGLLDLYRESYVSHEDEFSYPTRRRGNGPLDVLDFLLASQKPTNAAIQPTQTIAQKISKRI
jgi:hypothetical protein